MGPGETLGLHEPLLVNLLGHAAGAVAFGIFLVLLLRGGGARLPALAASLALLWNVSSGLSLILRDIPDWAGRGLQFAAYASLSLLPGVLLDIFAGARLRMAVRIGYLTCFCAIALHGVELFSRQPRVHEYALILTSVVFTVLAGWASIATVRASALRLFSTMALLLLALTLAHFNVAATESHWPLELILHHASIPLALFILLQDYRFVMADAFIRFLANIFLAVALAWAALLIAREPGPMAAQLAALSVLLLLFAFLRGQIQALLTRLVFQRSSLEPVLDQLRHSTAADVPRFLEEVRAAVADFAGADVEWQDGPGPHPDVALRLPVRAGHDETRTLGLGRRRGGRRYLSEDLQDLTRLTGVAESQIDEIREKELRQLVSHAELRALQSQIHPHFLFNALNTLYGVIPKESAGARRMVLNLADIFRYFLRNDRSFIALGEEVRIVKAYLEIESMRLGRKLVTEFAVDPAAEVVPIPVLSLQPLVENAVKHGIAPSARGGTVRLEASVRDGALEVSVFDTGPGFRTGETQSEGEGVGLDNVRRRLELHYGGAANLEIESREGATRVGFRAPCAVPCAS